MPFNPADNLPASPGDLRGLGSEWQTWLYETGEPAEGNNEAPLGFCVPEGGAILDPDAVPIADHPDVFRRYYAGSDVREVRFMVPRAVAVLGIGERFLFSFHAPYLPAPDVQTAPGEYVPGRCLLAIPEPWTPGSDITIRTYRLVRPRDAEEPIIGTRHDKHRTNGQIVTGEDGLPPPITTIEYKVLSQLGRVCRMLFASEREVALHDGR